MFSQGSCPMPDAVKTNNRAISPHMQSLPEFIFLFKCSTNIKFRFALFCANLKS